MTLLLILTLILNLLLLMTKLFFIALMDWMVAWVFEWVVLVVNHVVFEYFILLFSIILIFHNKTFESLEQFFEVVDLRRVNKKVIECLIKAGSFDDFGYHRSQLLAGYEKFVDAAENKRQDREVGQGSLFSLTEETEEQERVVLPDGKAWPRMTRLNYEKDVLGFFLSDHPLNGYESVCAAWANTHVNKIAEVKHKHKDDLNVYRSKDTYLELSPKAISKAKALKILHEKYDIKRKEIIAFGDNYNDVEMLDYVGIGVAVENARKEAKKVANYVTKHHKENGVAIALKKFFK